MGRLNSAFIMCRTAYPVATPVVCALLLGGVFGCVQVAIPRPDSVLSPVQVTCLAAGRFLMMRDGLEAVELEARRRGDLAGRLSRGAILGFFWFSLMLLAMNTTEAFGGSVLAVGFGAILFAAAMVIFPRRSDGFPLEDLGRGACAACWFGSCRAQRAAVGAGRAIVFDPLSLWRSCGAASAQDLAAWAAGGRRGFDGFGAVSLMRPLPSEPGCRITFP